MYVRRPDFRVFSPDPFRRPASVASSGTCVLHALVWGTGAGGEEGGGGGGGSKTRGPPREVSTLSPLELG